MMPWKPNREIAECPIEGLSGRDGIFRTLPTPEFAECKPFPIFGDNDLDLALRRRLPVRSISTIRNCLVHGHTAATFSLRGFRRATHWPVLPELSLQLPSGNYSSFFESHDQRWRLRENPKLTPTKTLERAVLIGSRYSFNYFHFICDSMIRALISIKEQPTVRSPFLIPKCAPQMISLLRQTFQDRELYVMEPHELLHVGELIVPVSSSYSPEDPLRTDQSVFDSPYLPELQSIVQHGTEMPDHGRRILYIERQNYRMNDGTIARTIVNQDAVIDHMRKIGALIVRPERMTIAEQRETFGNCDLVVGMAGAAFANTIFCKPGTSVVMLCQNATVKPEYFGLMFDILGINFSVVACPPVQGTNHHASHLSVTSDINVLAAAIEYVSRSQ